MGDQQGSKCPVPHDKPHPLIPSSAKQEVPAVADASKASGCPVSHGNPDQKNPLPTEREPSKIPTAHGKEGDTWTYPSPQMFFNAIKKKGWQNVHEEDMQPTVAIHNAVNEHCWQKIMEWENMHKDECAAPRLKKFQGRASDLSPKARYNQLMGYTAPFDRHDWIVDRCGTQVRYILDFYDGKKAPNSPVAMYVDVRPALDSVQAAVDITKKYFSNDNKN